LRFCHAISLPLLLISVTEAWAQFAIAGPLADELLCHLLGDVPGLPFMGCASVMVGGVLGRVFRISFSGERGYELAVPARYGAELYRHLVALAEGLGGGAYGIEALNVLRIEKGFITHAEIDGRVTAFDIGLQGMVSAKKDCIGKAASQRPGLTGSARLQSGWAAPCASPVRDHGGRASLPLRQTGQGRAWAGACDIGVLLAHIAKLAGAGASGKRARAPWRNIATG
jgi:glycine cleavage system aminomethyltransferase T